jgi:hypothetical protein
MSRSSTYVATEVAAVATDFRAPFSVFFVTEESTSTQNGKNIYREGAKYAKDVKNKRDFAFLQGLQDFLSDLRAFAVPSSSSGLSGLG